MPLSAPEFEESRESKIRRAVSKLVREDEYFSEKYAFGQTVNVYDLRPLIDDDMINAPQFFVQNVPERDSLNRMLGSFTRDTVHIRCVFIEPMETGEIEAGDTTIVDEIVHLERLLEWGSDGEGKGKLLDPDLTTEEIATTPNTVKELNVSPPVITRMLPVEHDTSPKDEEPNFVMYYPVIVSYETQQNRNTRRPQ